MAVETAARTQRNIARGLHLDRLRLPHMLIGGVLLVSAFDSASVVAPVNVKDGVYSTWGVSVGSRERLDLGFPQYYQRVLGAIPEDRYIDVINFELLGLRFRSDDILQLNAIQPEVLFWGIHFEAIKWKQAEKPPTGVQVGSSLGERFAGIASTIKGFQRPKILGRF